MDPQDEARPLHANHHFTIKTHVFEGPLDLLLNLIEKKKLFINDISLSKVTDDYISHINQLPEYSLKHRTQFILIASTLLLIKAKSLLPTLELTTEEESDIRDLERRLKILELIRRKSAHVREIYGLNPIFERGDLDEAICVFAPGSDISKESIKEGIYRILHALPKKIVEPKAIVKKVVSLEEMMERLEDRIQSAMKMTFREFSRNKSGEKAEKVNIIISFLAMLELVKQGAIEVSQERTFDEIEMERNDIATPRYTSTAETSTSF